MGQMIELPVYTGLVVDQVFCAENRRMDRETRRFGERLVFVLNDQAGSLNDQVIEGCTHTRQAVEGIGGNLTDELSEWCNQTFSVRKKENMALQPVGSELREAL